MATNGDDNSEHEPATDDVQSCAKETNLHWLSVQLPKELEPDDQINRWGKKNHSNTTTKKPTKQTEF